ncbi:MAG: ATP-dependent helicase HrpB [Hyphomicrobium sp.]|nr:MAG: ATP-dependent helicase HrpB [Hyphomicrobium sp.]
MTFPYADALPIDDVLPKLSAVLTASRSAVLVAPPGAGKTTRVPLALLDAPWLGGRRILVLEPRRLAARGAAERMARTLGERVGQTIGLRARLVSKVGPNTRIEVITEGVFTRMVIDDPSLDGVGAVLFDEFHERSLDADLGLALALDMQSGLSEDLRILVMSATLDGARVAALLGNAPVIESAGRAFPVETRYVGRDPHGRLDVQMCDAILRALRTEPGSILAFLPGQGEIRRVEERLHERISGLAAIVAPLHGAMDTAAQDRAVQPAAPGTRKIVLATSIAETSLTIEGVRVVVDCGLARVPRFEPDVGVTRLETVRVSRASADQRRGRAGRTQPGVCYRLWDEPQNQSLMPFADPEIRSADLAGLVLDCAEWGVTEPVTLSWLDPPPAAALAAARSELTALAALDATGSVTAMGRRLRALPLPPRLAAMVIRAADIGAERAAADIAALLVERGLGGTDTDLAYRLDNFHRERSGRSVDMRRLARGWAQSAASCSPLGARGKAGGGASGPAPEQGSTSPAALLALAFPDRIAKARGAPGHFVLANGRGARLEPTDPLSRAPYLVVAEMQGTAAATRILLAAATDEAGVSAVAGHRIAERDELTFDTAAAAVRARRIRTLDAITLSSEPRAVAPSDAVSEKLAEGLAGLGTARLPWSKSQIQLRDRVGFLRTAGDSTWPDLSDAALAVTNADWLAPYLAGKTRLADIGVDDLAEALDALLPWSLKSRLETDAPTHFEAPTGNRHAIDYDGDGAPALHIRVQELFGLTTHPAIAGGRLALTLHLLSPAHRPIQITRDLPGFWAGSWSAVKSEMKGRYPRHPWPDDPASAAPTARAKPRGT